MSIENPAPDHGAHEDEGRRDFLFLTAAAFGAVGAGSVAWPFIDQMNPAADTVALSTTEVNLAPIEPGQAITVMWQGKPVFIRPADEQRQFVRRRRLREILRGAAQPQPGIRRQRLVCTDDMFQPAKNAHQMPVNAIRRKRPEGTFIVPWRTNGVSRGSL